MQLGRRIGICAANDCAKVTPREPRLPEVSDAQPVSDAVEGDGLPVLLQEFAEASDSPTLMSASARIWSTIQSIVRSGIFFDVVRVL